MDGGLISIIELDLTKSLLFPFFLLTRSIFFRLFSFFLIIFALEILLGYNFRFKSNHRREISVVKLFHFVPKFLKVCLLTLFLEFPWTLLQEEANIANITKDTVSYSKWYNKYARDLTYEGNLTDGSDAILLLEYQYEPWIFMPTRTIIYSGLAKRDFIKRHHKVEPPKKLPTVVVFCIYHGQKPYPYGRDLGSCYQNEELGNQETSHRFHLIDLPTLPDEEIALFELGSFHHWLLKYAYNSKKLVSVIEKYQSLIKRIINTLGQSYLEIILTYIIREFR